MPRQKSTTNDDDEDIIPLWFLLPRHFYERLADARKEFGLPRTKLIMRGLELAIQEQEAKRSGKTRVAKGATVSDDALSDALRSVAHMRWEADNRAIAMALFPFRNPITEATECLGGIAMHIWTWSGIKCPSRI